MSDDKKKLTLGSVRSYLMTAASALVLLKIVLWALWPYLPYMIAGAALITVIGVAIYRTTKI